MRTTSIFSGSHETANVSRGSGIPFRSSAPTGSNATPARRVAIMRVRAEIKMPSLSALSQSRAASVGGMPK